jgi:hypothetical protein
MTSKLKLAALAALAAAAFIGGAMIALGPAKAADFGSSNRYDYGYDSREEYAPPRERVLERRDDYRDYDRHSGHHRLARIEAEGSYDGGYMPQYLKEWRAQRLAIAAWREKVSQRYGREFSFWRAASEKQLNCTSTRNGVYCSISGIPNQGGRNWWSWNDGGQRPGPHHGRDFN